MRLPEWFPEPRFLALLSFLAVLISTALMGMVIGCDGHVAAACVWAGFGTLLMCGWVAGWRYL